MKINLINYTTSQLLETFNGKLIYLLLIYPYIPSSQGTIILSLSYPFIPASFQNKGFITLCTRHYYALKPHFSWFHYNITHKCKAFCSAYKMLSYWPAIGQ